MEPQKSNTSVIVGIIVAVIALLGFGLYKYANKETATTEVGTGTTTDVSVTVGNDYPTPVETTISSKYKDGIYSAVGNYTSPGGSEQIAITLTLKDDVIVDASAVSKAFRPNSKIFQGQFVDNFKPLVIGKKIDDVHLTKVSGSSLTGIGFNDAVAQIKVQAQA